MNIKNMLLVGATARNAGKTSFCLEFIEKYSKQANITGLKITAIHGEKATCHRGAEGCGVCTAIMGKYEIVEETDPSGSKDTNKLLAAGAKRVFWIRAFKEHMLEAFNKFYASVPESSVIVCESNSLAEIITPGVMILMHGGAALIKPSSIPMIDKSDFIVDMRIQGSIKTVIDKIEITYSGLKPSVVYNGIYKNFTLVILAGGKSRRMGRDKSELIYNGISFLENMVVKGEICGFSEIIISGSEKKIIGAKNIMDEIMERGPLSGLHSCLKNAANPFCLVVTVDVPKLDLDALAQMAEFHILHKYRATLLVAQGKLDPLIGIYNSNLHIDIYNLIKEEPRRIIDLFDNIPCGLFDFKGNCNMLDNINTREDYINIGKEANQQKYERKGKKQC